MFPSRTKIVFFGSAITGFLLQLAALYGFGQWPFLAPLLLHLTGALCFWPFSVRILPANLRERKLAGVFFGSIVFLVPCMGIVFAIGLALVFRARSFQKSERCYVFAEESVPDIFAFQSRTEVSTSILQILNSPDVSNRRKAVLALRAIEPRFALPFLRRAVQDSDEHVRIFAQGILTEIVEQFDKSIKVMEKEIAEGGGA
ncbi:MAG: HEAT repeat domain-containing protein [Opitutales bacterium]